jgi:hypothetical protein
MTYNVKNSDFVELFASESFVKAYIDANKDAKINRQMSTNKKNELQVTSSYVPMIALAVLVVGYAYFKIN